MSKKHLHNQAAIPLAPAVFKVSFNDIILVLRIQLRKKNIFTYTNAVR